MVLPAGTGRQAEHADNSGTSRVAWRKRDVRKRHQRAAAGGRGRPRPKHHDGRTIPWRKN